MKEIAVLEYMFIFEPGNTWQTGSKFENDLKDFFAANGLEADIVETRGSSSRRVMFIAAIEPSQKQPVMKNTDTRVIKPAPQTTNKFKQFIKNKGGRPKQLPQLGYNRGKQLPPQKVRI